MGGRFNWAGEDILNEDIWEAVLGLGPLWDEFSFLQDQADRQPGMNVKGEGRLDMQAFSCLG